MYKWPELYGFFLGVTNDWMSSVFEMLFLFLLVIISLLSSPDNIDARMDLLAGCNVVLVLIGSHLFIIKYRQDVCLCGITCR